MRDLILFFAIDLPDSLKDKITKRLQEFDFPFKIKYTPKENLHLTLLFLGNIPTDQLFLIVKIAGDVIEKFKVINLYGTDINVAPSNSCARMLWLNFEENEDLENIKHQLTKKLEESKITFQKECRKMKLHITLARFEPTRINFEKIRFPIHFKTNEIFLMERQLQKPHPVYLPLQRFLLK